MVINCKNIKAAKWLPVRPDMILQCISGSHNCFFCTFNRILFYSVGHLSCRLVEGGSEADGVDMFTDGITGAIAEPLSLMPSFSQQDLSLIFPITTRPWQKPMTTSDTPNYWRATFAIQMFAIMHVVQYDLYPTIFQFKS